MKRIILAIAAVVGLAACTAKAKQVNNENDNDNEKKEVMSLKGKQERVYLHDPCGQRTEQQPIACEGSRTRRQRIGLYKDPTGVRGITVGNTRPFPAFNLQGRQVPEGCKGIVIRNGRKMIQRQQIKKR